MTTSGQHSSSHQDPAAAAPDAGCGPLLRPQHCDLVATLRSLVRPLRAAEEAERLAQLHRSKIKRLRAVSRHLEAELARRKMLKCDRQVQTEGFVNPFSRAFAQRAAAAAAATAAAAVSVAPAAPPAPPAPPASRVAPAAPVHTATATAAAASATATVTIDLTHDRYGVPRPPPVSAASLATLPACLKLAPLLALRPDPADRQSAELHWRLRGLSNDQCAPVASYSVWYCYQRPGQPADAWAKTADLRALPLPMRCQVGLDLNRGACHFVLRSEDRLARTGQWSNVVSWPPVGAGSGR